jgi:hypothetical protein
VFQMVEQPDPTENPLSSASPASPKVLHTTTEEIASNARRGRAGAEPPSRSPPGARTTPREGNPTPGGATPDDRPPKRPPMRPRPLCSPCARSPWYHAAGTHMQHPPPTFSHGDAMTRAPSLCAPRPQAAPAEGAWDGADARSGRSPSL